MSVEDDLRYAQERMRAYGFENGNRAWHGPGRGYQETSSEARGPTALEIALVRKLGSKVRLYAEDFKNVRDFVVHRTEDATDGSVVLEVRDKADARHKTVTLTRQPDGSYADDRGL